MSFVDLFSDSADRYAAAPRYPDALDRFPLLGRRRRSTPPGDCGTGNGQAAVDLARHFKTVWATDPSQAQIDQAIPCHGVIYSVQPAERVSFADHSVDAITVAQALHWFELERFFPEARRVLKPGGFSCAWGYSLVARRTGHRRSDASIDSRRPIRKYWADQNAALWEGYKNVHLPFKAVDAPSFSIRMEWTLLEYMAYVHTWSATRRAIQADGPSFFEAACKRMDQAWGGQDRVRQVKVPLAVIAGVATSSAA
ncbi:MAG: class I SAM-dependent methyltransferase [Burkholderiaceae bacterium]|nr:class I SAM-dependent methyltransferase [Burkholderiaceae bacterium]